MGHVRNYSIGDAVARFKWMRGFNVLHPIGWDAFGLPAENAALKHGAHPEDWTRSNIAHMKSQLQRLGFSYAWDRGGRDLRARVLQVEPVVLHPDVEKGPGLPQEGRRQLVPVRTVLANEQVVDGWCWRCDSEVVQKDLEQWFLRITSYADELLEQARQPSGMATDGAHAPAKLDRQIGGRRAGLPACGGRGQHSGLHHAH